MRPELLTTLLRDVSRSFYLTLRWLPRAVRRQIGLAYLLARTTDTVADTELIPVERRIDALDALQKRIAGRPAPPLELAAFAEHHAGLPERRLVERVEEAIALLNALSMEDQQLIREVMQTILSGQTLDLRRFRGASRENIIALRTDEELEDYTYRVAGCVGEFWTRICRARLFPHAPMDEERLLADAVRFGKGLQLVNILRDLATDLTQGRCYLPADSLGQLGLKPAVLLDPTQEPALRPLYDRLLDRAADCLRDGWHYTNMLPRSSMRVRLVCAWPILIGRKTLARLRHQNILDSRSRIKITRREVHLIVLRSVLAYPWPQAWNRLYAEGLSRPPP